MLPSEGGGAPASLLPLEEESMENRTYSIPNPANLPK
jgi:hypothetical protein